MDADNFLGFAMDATLYLWIKENLSPDSTILEFGSGTGTKELVKHYQVTSVEHSKEWLDVADTNYIYAPIDESRQWYSWESLKVLQNKTFDLILVDGPRIDTRENMKAWYQENFSVFEDGIMIIDDNCYSETKGLIKIIKELGWHLVHQGGVQQNHYWGVYRKYQECPECATEYLKLSDMLNCCEQNFK
jgi:tRNA A58 N-methylase Trm61|tara:strand:- start:2684 stop:3250 length:567 start_codon:yes stop_codon:yes gene_type:complete